MPAIGPPEGPPLTAAIATVAHEVQEIPHISVRAIPHTVTASKRDDDRPKLVRHGPESSEPELAPPTLGPEPPLPIASVPLSYFWSFRLTNDPGARWIRSIVMATFAGLQHRTTLGAT